MHSPITTHVLDTSLGRPAAGLNVLLDFHEEGIRWKLLAESNTNADGRIEDFLPEDTRLAPGIYRLTFDTASYFHNSRVETFYPSVIVIFEVEDIASHYHVPLLLSPYGYSTYRGS